MCSVKSTLGHQYCYALFMACCSVLMSLSFNQNLNNDSAIPVSDLHYSLIVFSGTFLAYSFSILTPFVNLQKRKIVLKKINFPILLSLVVFSFLLLALYFSTGHGVQFFLASALTFTYYTGVGFGKVRFKGTRTIFLIKNIVLALAWALVTSPLEVYDPTCIFLFLNRFLFILSLSIIIDIRDLSLDQMEKIVTLPIKAGIRSTKIIAIILLVAGTAFIYKYSHISKFHSSTVVASVISSAATVLAIVVLNKSSSYRQFILFIDGNLFLHALLFFLASNDHAFSIR